MFNASSCDLQTPNLLARIYYPCSNKSWNGSWLPRTHFYALGIHDFSQHKSWTYPIFYLVLLFAKSDASLHAPLLSPTQLRSCLLTDASNTTRTEATDTVSPRLPVIIFSPGLGGFRGSYSHICAMFARNGCTVFSIEHRDGSACASYHPTNPLKYAYPTTPVGEIEEEFMHGFRCGQRDMKGREVEQLVELIRKLDSGEDVCEGVEMSAKERKILASFKGRLDLDSLIVCGHSFGGSTALSAIQEQGHPFKAAIVFDPWMLSVDLAKTTSVPVFTLQSATFHWRENLRQLLHHFNALDSRSMIAVISDSRHEDCTDYGLVFPVLMSMIGARGIRHPRKTKIIWERICMRYLATVSGNAVLAKHREGMKDHPEVIVGDEAIAYLKDNQKEEYCN